jgi:hypothetical protein
MRIWHARSGPKRSPKNGAVSRFFGVLLALALSHPMAWSADQGPGAAEKSAARSPADVNTKINEWLPHFIAACEKHMRGDMGGKRATRYCKCSAEKHSQYVIKKAADPDEDTFNVDSHLAELVDMYKNPGKYQGLEGRGEPTVLDLDLDLTATCGK